MLREIYNMDLDSQKKRQRSVNWDEVEKAMLVECLADEIHIIENKKKLTLCNRDRNTAWGRIKNKMEIQGYNRDVQRIKEQWQRMKVQAKKAVSLHKKSLKQTGGGPSQPEPTEIEWRMKDLLPHEFIEDYSPFDSDSALTPQPIVEKPTNVAKVNMQLNSENPTNNIAKVDLQLNPITGVFETETDEELTLMYEEGANEEAVETETKKRKIEDANERNKPSTPGRGKAIKRKPMTEYEQKLYELNKMRILQNMKQSEEMHNLKLENEKEFHKERMRSLQMQ